MSKYKLLADVDTFYRRKRVTPQLNKLYGIKFKPDPLKIQSNASAEHKFPRVAEGFVVVVALLFYDHGKPLRSFRDGQLT